MFISIWVFRLEIAESRTASAGLLHKSDGFIVVVACLPRPMEGMGRLQFSDLLTELPVPPHAIGVVGTF